MNSVDRFEENADMVIQFGNQSNQKHIKPHSSGFSAAFCW